MVWVEELFEELGYVWGSVEDIVEDLAVVWVGELVGQMVVCELRSCLRNWAMCGGRLNWLGIGCGVGWGVGRADGCGVGLRYG